MDGKAVQSVLSHKGLGVLADSQLRFHQHIRATVSKDEGIAINLLKTTVNRSLSSWLLFLYDIQPVLDFPSPIWNTGFTGDLQLKSVQHRWTKHVTALTQLSYPERLSTFNLYSIRGRLLHTNMILHYKIFHNIFPIKPSDLFPMSPHTSTRGHRFKVKPAHSQTESCKHFFSYVVPHWIPFLLILLRPPL